MGRCRVSGLAVLGIFMLGIGGCEGGAPPTGSRAASGPDLLEKQRVKLAELKAKMKTVPAVRPRTGH
jgi:hypothetical protein